MTTYYHGITAAFEHTDEVAYRLRALSEAIPELKVCLTPQGDESFDSLYLPMQSDAFKQVKQHISLFEPELSSLPKDITEYHTEIQLGYASYDNSPFVELYIPVVSTNSELANKIAENAMYPVLLSLFGESLLGIQSKSGTQNDVFTDLKSTCLYGDAHADSRYFQDDHAPFYL